MNAASRVIDGAAEGKDGKRHGAASFELRASSRGGRGQPLLQAAPFNRRVEIWVRLLAPGLKRLRKTLFLRPQLVDPHVGPDGGVPIKPVFGLMGWRCPRLGGPARARRQLNSR